MHPGTWMVSMNYVLNLTSKHHFKNQCKIITLLHQWRVCPAILAEWVSLLSWHTVRPSVACAFYLRAWFYLYIFKVTTFSIKVAPCRASISQSVSSFSWSLWPLVPRIARNPRLLGVHHISFVQQYTVFSRN